MIPEPVITTIKELGACQAARDVLDYVEGKLGAITDGRQGTRISRAGGGSILVLDQEPQSPRAGPGSLVLPIKIPQIPDAGPLQRTLHVHDDRVGGRGIAKAFILATVLDWLAGIPARHLVGALRIVLYEWHDGIMPALDQFAAVLPLDHAFTWFLEPTASLACPVEKGFGKLTASFEPGEQELPVDASQVLARDITGRFKPAHPVYPLDQNNRLSFRFLPGAELATASASAPRGEVHVAFTHHPLATSFKQELTEYVNNQAVRIGVKQRMRVRTNYHFPGAKFDSNSPNVQRFTGINVRLFNKEPYMDWHVLPSMASAVYKHHPGAAGIVCGPGEPFLLDDAQAIVSSKEAGEFRDLLEATASEFLFKT